MRAYPTDRIISDVKVILDSHGYSEPINGDGGDYLDRIIESSILGAARLVLQNAKTERVMEAAVILSNSADCSPGGGNIGRRFALPVSFLRFLYGKLSDWKQSVWNLLPESSDAYLLQAKAGACANPLRPVGFLHAESGNNFVELYGSRQATALTGSIAFIEDPSLTDVTKAFTVYIGTATSAIEQYDEINFTAGGKTYTTEINHSAGVGAGDELVFIKEYPYLFKISAGVASKASLRCDIDSSPISPGIPLNNAEEIPCFECYCRNYYAYNTLVKFSAGSDVYSFTASGDIPGGSLLRYVPRLGHMFVHTSEDGWFASPATASSGNADETLEATVTGRVLYFPSVLYQAVLYQTAGMTAAQTQEQKLAEDLISIANNLMQ